MKLSQIRKYIYRQAKYGNMHNNLHSLDEWLYKSSTKNFHIHTLYNALLNANRYTMDREGYKLKFIYAYSDIQKAFLIESCADRGDKTYCKLFLHLVVYA